MDLNILLLLLLQNKFTSEMYSQSEVLHFAVTFLFLLKNCVLCKTWSVYLSEVKGTNVCPSVWYARQTCGATTDFNLILSFISTVERKQEENPVISACWKSDAHFGEHLITAASISSRRSWDWNSTVQCWLLGKCLGRVWDKESDQGSLVLAEVWGQLP